MVMPGNASSSSTVPPSETVSMSWTMSWRWTALAGNIVTLSANATTENS